MPYGYRRRYQSNRRRNFKPKRMYKRNWMSRKVGKNDGRRFFKLHGSTELTSTAGGVISQYWSLTNPTAFVGGSGTVEDWTNVSGLFDTYRVHAIKIKFIPTFPNDTSAQTGYYPLYTLVDYNSTGTVASSIGTAIAYENMNVKNMFRPWQRYVRVPKNAQGDYVNGYMSSLTPVSLGILQVYGEGFDISTIYGRVIYTMYLSAKYRK